MRRRAFTPVELLVVIAIIGIAIGPPLPAINAGREAGRRIQCKNNLHNTALAFINHDGIHIAINSNSTTPHNWSLVAITP